MKREGAPEEEIHKAEAESERLSKQHADKMDDYLRKSVFMDKVGAFEGAGYSSRGLYRPMLDCLMFTKGAKPYCKVCEQAIINVIKQYTQ
ncbi:MAG: M64 family metallopeptidase, partial [Candidatus Aminicenantaceae bacterium]